MAQNRAVLQWRECPQMNADERFPRKRCQQLQLRPSLTRTGGQDYGSSNKLPQINCACKVKKALPEVLPLRIGLAFQCVRFHCQHKRQLWDDQTKVTTNTVFHSHDNCQEESQIMNMNPR